MSDQFNLKHDKPEEVRSLFTAAKKRREQKMKYHLLSEMLNGKTADITKSTELFEALNREKMEFEELLKLHPEEVKENIEYVKERRVEQGGRWWNPNSAAKWGEKGVIPPCCYYARPREYWKDKALVDCFLNQFPVFRISDKRL